MTLAQQEVRVERVVTVEVRVYDRGGVLRPDVVVLVHGEVTSWPALAEAVLRGGHEAARRLRRYRGRR